MTLLDCRPVLDDGFSPAIGHYDHADRTRRGWQVRVASRWLDVELSWPMAGSGWAIACSRGVLLTLDGAAPIWCRTPDEVWAAADAETDAALRALVMATVTEALLAESAGPGVDGDE